MKKNKISLSAALISTMISGTLVSGLPGNVFASTNLPSDLNQIGDSGSKEAVQYLFQNGKLSGFSDGTFRPESTVTRAEFAAMILNSVDTSGVGSKVTQFSDVKPGDWDYSLLQEAYGLGILGGTYVSSDGTVTMSPNDTITREEMLTILVRVHEKYHDAVAITDDEVNSVLANFTDGDQIPSWARVSVAKALKYNITSGVETNLLGIGQKGSRLQAALFQYRTLQDNSAQPTTPAKDSTAPKIVLKGNSNVTIYQGDTYTDAGVTATDDVDGDISSKVVVSGDTVNTSKAGTYVVKYDVTDAAGNKADEVQRTVTVKTALASLDLTKDVIQLTSSSATVGDVKSILSERYELPTSNIHFVSPVSDTWTNITGTPAVKLGDFDPSQWVIVDSYAKDANGNYSKSALYKVVIDNNASSVTIDNNAKTITANSTNTVSDVRTAFQANAASVIGDNTVNFYSEQKSTAQVYGDSTAFIAASDNSVQAKIVHYIFSDSLNVTSSSSSLTVSGLQFENLVDLYSYNESTGATTLVKANNEVKVDGTYTFSNLTPGNYIIVKQPTELGQPGDSAYDNEYARRLRDENKYLIPYQITPQINASGAYDLLNNYSQFSLANTDTTADFFKQDAKVANITGGHELHAEIDYQYRTQRVKFLHATLSFGTDSVGNPAVTVPTVGLNMTPDYTYFAVGDVVNFNLVLKDYDSATNTTYATATIPLQATVVIKNQALTLQITHQ